MTFAGGDPVALRAAGRRLGTLGENLSDDSLDTQNPGRDIAAAATGDIGGLAQNAVAAAGGAVGAAAILVTAMGSGSDTSGEQLELATGGPVAR